MNVLGCSLRIDTAPLFSLSEYSGPATRLPSPSREATSCEVWGSSPIPEGKMERRRKVKLWFCTKGRTKRGERRVQAPGSVACSQDTPSRPLAGRWVTLVTRHASSVGSAVAWGLRTESRVKAKVGSGREEKEESKIELCRIEAKRHVAIFARYTEFPLISLFNDFTATYKHRIFILKIHANLCQ